MRIRTAFAALATALALTAGCNDDPNRSEPPAALSPLGGNGQNSTVGAQLANPVVVRVTDDDGDPVRGVTVAFQVVSGGGGVQPASVTTGSDGLAQATWTLGPAAGPQTLAASVEGLQPLAFTATAAAGAPARLRIQPDSTALTGVGLSAEVTVAYVDAFGNPAGTPGADALTMVSLEPAVAEATALVTPGRARVTARGAGRARIVATAGPLADTAVVGVVQVPATVNVLLQGSGPTVVVSRTAQAVAIVRDAGGTEIPNAQVTWSSTDNAVLTVNAQGVVTGVAPGTAHVQARTANDVLGGLVVTVIPAFQAGAFSAGGATTCAATPEGRAYCWGSSHTGQGGFGSLEWAVTPTAVQTDLRFQAISTGGIPEPETQYLRSHTCALTGTGAAWCWGMDAWGQLGAGALSPTTCRLSPNNSWKCSRTPVQVAGGHAWRSIAAGATHTCAVTTGGTAYCWGSNEHGQLGAATAEVCPRTSNTDGERPCATAPVQVAGVPAFTTVTAGEGYTCALTAVGAAWCWGLNNQGQLGNGTTGGSPVPVPVAGGLSFTRISAEWSHTCGVTTGGNVYCWGRNTSGQLGNGTSASSPTPVQVGGGGAYQDVSAGRHHSCAVRTDGSAYCWGTNANGQLGAPGVAGALAPVPVAGGHRFDAISAASMHSCARRTGDSVLMCWGSGSLGRLGNGGQTDSPVPVAVGFP